MFKLILILGVTFAAATSPNGEDTVYAVDHYEADTIPDFYDYDYETSTITTTTKKPKPLKCLKACEKKCGAAFPKGNFTYLVLRYFLPVFFPP